MSLESLGNEIEYPPICPGEGCEAELSIATPEFAQYGCCSFISGFTGRFIAGSECRSYTGPGPSKVEPVKKPRKRRKNR
jgi:hypothetical protein